jgi:hypothetical protein
MKKATTLAMVVLLAVVLTPGRADAHAGWWDWFEGLSGPGPFSNGWVLDFRPFCSVRVQSDRAAQGSFRTDSDERWTSVFAGDDAAKHCLVNSNEVGGYFEFRGGMISTRGDKGLFHDKPFELQGKATAHQFQGVFMRQLDPTIAIGAGAGVLWFSGANIEQTVTRFTVTPVSVAISPLRFIWRRESRAGFLLVRFEEVAVLGSLEAQDFHSASTSAFKIKNDMVRSLSITVDALTLFGKVP